VLTKALLDTSSLWTTLEEENVSNRIMMLYVMCDHTNVIVALVEAK
jgi:hypothetical protein